MSQNIRLSVHGTRGFELYRGYMRLECKAFVKHGWVAKLKENERKEEEKEGRKGGRKIKRKRERGSRLFMDLFVAT